MSLILVCIINYLNLISLMIIYKELYLNHLLYLSNFLFYINWKFFFFKDQRTNNFFYCNNSLFNKKKITIKVKNFIYIIIYYNIFYSIKSIIFFINLKCNKKFNIKYIN